MLPGPTARCHDTSSYAVLDRRGDPLTECTGFGLFCARNSRSVMASKKVVSVRQRSLVVACHADLASIYVASNHGKGCARDTISKGTRAE